MSEPVALLLAAGLGTRLKPLTEVLPKCLMPIKGHPLLFYWLEQIKNLGISQCVVNLHHHGDLVRRVIEDSPYADWVQYVHEVPLLGTAGTVRAAYRFFAGQPLWLIHADNLSVANWVDFIATYHRQCQPGEMLMQTFTTDHPKSCGVVTLDAQQRVVEFHEKVQNPPSALANGAVYMLSPELGALVARNNHIHDFSTQVVPTLLGRISTWHTDGYHRDIGRWPAYVAAQREFAVDWRPQESGEWRRLWRNPDFLKRWQQSLLAADQGRSTLHRSDLPLVC